MHHYFELSWYQKWIVLPRGSSIDSLSSLREYRSNNNTLGAIIQNVLVRRITSDVSCLGRIVQNMYSIIILFELAISLETPVSRWGCVFSSSPAERKQLPTLPFSFWSLLHGVCVSFESRLNLHKRWVKKLYIDWKFKIQLVRHKRNENGT